MNKILMCLLLCTVPLAAEQTNILPTYHVLTDPSHRLVVLGKALVIQDARGFFVGYYKPVSPPTPTFHPVTPRQSGLYTGLPGNPSYHDNKFLMERGNPYSVSNGYNW